MADEPPVSKHGGPRPIVREDDGRRTRSGHKFEVREGEREKVANLARACTARQIAVVLRGADEPVSAQTICDHFRQELEWGRANMIGEVSGKMVDMALGGNVQAGLRLLEWFGDPGQFVTKRELTGPGGGAIQVIDVAEATERLRGLKDEDLPDLERAAAIFRRLFGDRAEGTAPAPDAPGPDSGGD